MAKERKNNKIVRLKNKMKNGMEKQSVINQKKDTHFSIFDLRFYFLFGLFVIVLSAILLSPARQIATKAFSLGEISPRNVYAPEDLLVEDHDSTSINRKKASSSAYDVYDLKPEVLKTAAGKIDGAFKLMESGYIKHENEAYAFLLRELEETELLEYGTASGEIARKKNIFEKSMRKFKSSADFSELENKFARILGIEFSEKTFKVLRWHHYRPKIAEWLDTILKELMEKGIVASKNALPRTSRSRITIARTGLPETPMDVSIEEVFDIKQAALFASSRVGQLVAPQHPSLKREMVNILGQFIEPNLVFNKSATLEAKNNASEAVSPVFFRVKKGELIARKGERITSEHILKIQGADAQLKNENRLQAMGGRLLFFALILGVSWVYFVYFLPEFAASRSNIILLGLLFITEVALLRFVSAGANVFATLNPDIALDSYLYAAPYAMAPLIAAIFFSTEVTVIVTLATALTVSLIFPQANTYVLLAVAGGVAAIFQIGRIKRRTDVWLAGLILMAVNITVIVVGQLLDSALITQATILNIAFGALGAFGVVALTLTLLPLIEMLFPVVSNIKLLELLDLNHPLLSKMAVVAPGTYHHSVIVGNLAEEAAEAVGANPLLARVGSYFHDIGKTDKPEYFVENQRDNDNKHDNLNPSMSALIIASHVTIGLEMAKQYKLIPQVSSMISEHHGTQLIHFFYQKAKGQEKAEHAAVNEHDYRYTGRKPQTRESAIVALADAVEASSRSLKNPTSSRLKQLVSKIIEKKVQDGELDESRLTLHDLGKIKDSFVRVLHGIFHYRVEYPGENIDDENIDNRKEGDQRSERNEGKKKTGSDFKKIG